MVRNDVTQRLLTVWGGLPLLAAGVSREKQSAEVPSPPFEEVFALAEIVELGEDPSDSIAEVGEFFERRGGGFVIGDRLLPRVRTYRDDGSLEAGFGRFGDGPWEFRRIRSVTEMVDGRIVVTGRENGALTYLAPDLTPHSMLLIEGFTSSMLLPFGPGLVFTGRARDVDLVAEMDGIFHRLVGSAVTWSSWNTLAASKPYWNALGGLQAAVGGDSVYVMAGILYPATILNGAGDSVGTIGRPPPGFRRVPEIEPGAFAFTSPEGPAAQTGNLAGPIGPRTFQLERPVVRHFPPEMADKLFRSAGSDGLEIAIRGPWPSIRRTARPGTGKSPWPCSAVRSSRLTGKPMLAYHGAMTCRRTLALTNMWTFTARSLTEPGEPSWMSSSIGQVNRSSNSAHVSR